MIGEYPVIKSFWTSEEQNIKIKTLARLHNVSESEIIRRLIENGRITQSAKIKS